MGKLVRYLTMIIFIDLLFLLTGQFAIVAPGSFILGAILDPSGIESSVLFISIAAAIGFVGAAGGVATLTGSNPRDSVLFSAFALLMLALALDYVAIYVYLISLGTAATVLGSVILAPLIIMFVFSVIEWQRGRD